MRTGSRTSAAARTPLPVNFRTISTSPVASIGLAILPSAPALAASAASNGSNAPTSNTTGKLDRRGSCLIERQSSYPFFPNKNTSANTRSGVVSLRLRSAAYPSVTAVISTASPARASTKTRSWLGLRSASRIFLFKAKYPSSWSSNAKVSVSVWWQELSLCSRG